MAAGVEIASLALRIDSSEATTAEQRLDRMAQAGDKAEQGFGLLSAGATRLATALAGLFAAERVATFLQQSAAAAGQLQTALNATAGVMKLTAEQTRELERAARELAAGTIFSAQQVGQAFDAIAQDAGSLAETPEQLQAITDAAITLATAARTSLPEAGDALLQVLRQFQGTDANDAAQILVELGSSAGELQETTAALDNAGDVAGQLGISLTDLAAAISLLAAAGIEGGEAGAGLRQVLQELESSGGAAAPSIVGLGEALRAAADAGVVFEGRGFAVGKVLTSNAASFEDVATSIAESDAATRLSEQALRSYEGQMAAATAAVGSLQAAIGAQLIPGATDAARVTTELVTALAELGGPAGVANNELSAMGLVAGQLGGVLYGLSSGVVALGEDIGGLSAVAAAFFSMDFTEAGLRWDTWMADREARAERFAERMARITDPRLAAQRGEAPAELPTPEPPDVELYARELFASTEAAFAEIDRYVAQYAEGAEKPKEAKKPEATFTDAAAFLATAQVELTEDPLAKLSVQFEQELAAYAAQGSRLVEAGVLSEDQRAQAILSRRLANEAELTDAARQAQTDRAATLLALEAEAAVSEGDAARLRLEANLLQRQKAILDAAGSEEAAMQLTQQIRARGLAAIEKQEAEHAARLRDIETRKWRDQLQGAITGTGALLSLFTSSNERAFAIQKAAAIASTLINAYQSASDAYRNALKDGGNPYIAAGMAALASTAQLAQVVGVRGVTLGGGGGGVVSAPATPTTGGSTLNESGDSSAPSREVIRNSERFPTFPAAGVSVVVNNQTPAQVDVRETTGPDGGAAVELVIKAVANDIAQGGETWQAMSRRTGIQPRLGVRA